MNELVSFLGENIDKIYVLILSIFVELNVLYGEVAASKKPFDCKCLSLALIPVLMVDISILQLMEEFARLVSSNFTVPVAPLKFPISSWPWAVSENLTMAFSESIFQLMNAWIVYAEPIASITRASMAERIFFIHSFSVKLRRTNYRRQKNVVKLLK